MRIGRTWIERLVGIGVGVAVVVAVIWAALPKSIAIEASLVSQGPLEVSIDEEGQTRIRDRYTISAPLTGTLIRVEHKPGDAVKEGDVLIRIVPLPAPLLDERTRSEAQARVVGAESARKRALAETALARAALDLAQSEANRQRMLAKTGATSREALERALIDLRSRTEHVAATEFGARVATAEIAMARAALGHVVRGGAGTEAGFEVKAPVSGQVLRVFQESEGVVQAGKPLIEIGDPRALEVVVDVLTQDAVRVAAGQPVIIERWGGDTPLNGRVRLVEPSAFTVMSALGIEEQRVNVIVDVELPSKGRKPGDGYRVESRIITWSSPKVVKVPEGALFRDGDSWAVFVVTEGRAAHRRVALGRRNGIETEVRRGLRKGEQVILHPSDRVAPGVRVESGKQ